jgi:hypothetical protein
MAFSALNQKNLSKTQKPYFATISIPTGIFTGSNANDSH